MAILFGLLGAYVVRKQLLKPEVAKAKEAAKPEMLVVPVAAADLPAGRRVTLGDIAVLRLTAEQLKKKGFDKPFMNRTPQIIGRILKDEIKRGASFEPGAFYAEGTGPNVAEQLQPGYRAVTFSVEVDAAVAGFTTAGSVVDVLFRCHPNDDADLPEMTVPLLEGVKVLALNADTTVGARTGAQGRHSVTIAVRPEQAAALQVVAGRGTMSLALRNPNDVEQFVSTSPRTLDELLDRPSRRSKIDVYRGRGMSKVEFRNRERTTPTLPANVTQKPAPIGPTQASPELPVNVSAPANGEVEATTRQ